MKMANWDKLNSKFNQVIDNMSSADWDNWSSQRMDRKDMRNSKILLKAKLQEEKLLLSSNKGNNIFSELSNSYSVCTTLQSTFTGLVQPSVDDYSIAA